MSARGRLHRRLAAVSCSLAFACLAVSACDTPTDPSRHEDENRPPSASGSARLTIPPVFQETAVWCWAAVAEMVLRHYGQPNLNPLGDYQCGIVGTTAALGMLPPQCTSNCGLCVTTFGSPPQYVRLLQEYPIVARQVGGVQGRPLLVAFNASALPFVQIRAHIDAGHPVVAGITPAGFPSAFGPAHVALIIGYRFSATEQRLIVNDPYPYLIGPLGPYGDPYLSRGATLTGRGQYDIDYAAFAGGLFWSQSFMPQ
jgi:hypothetical protein